jgi:hypothetical protein
MSAALAGCGLDVTVVSDGDVLADKPTDHALRNSRLRRALYASGAVDDVFVQSDDDNRPLRPVPLSDFLDPSGGLISYAFHDLRLWKHDQYPFDRQQHNTRAALDYWGASTYAFASHMPQAMDRHVFEAAFLAAETLSDEAAFCEWGLPLNHGRLVSPERFGEVRTFRTFAWPEYPDQWPMWREADGYAFENFYEALYEPGHLLAGISTALDTAAPEAQAFEKITRWHDFARAAARLEFPDDVANPWVTGPAKKAMFAAARQWRRWSQHT